VNDFDEVWPILYTSGLIRLAASAEIGGVGLKHAVAPILEGYRAALAAGGRPLVLAEDNLDLRQMASARLKDPGKLWARLDALPTRTGNVPKVARAAIVRRLPEPGAAYRIVHRVAGPGSLGRQRFVALAHSHGAWSPGKPRHSLLRPSPGLKTARFPQAPSIRDCSTAPSVAPILSSVFAGSGSPAAWRRIAPASS
jgi:hypothetical protein